ALDAAARILERHHVRVALLDFGGQVLAMGRPRGSAGWPVGIADPLDRDVPVAVISGSDVSISTSGNGERSAAGPEGPIGHILDPVSKRSAAFQGSVTVVAVDGTSADALSTALFVMGPDEGPRWADGRRIAALYLWRDPDGSLGRRATRAFDESFPGWSGSIEH
ncbi:MAG TPA: FAD:protein FMN transferase, partial [Candidatus Polarisedimenticolia bacterium]|nr:FAD:protein FMN transferase [Candidatus Polarisedimenticolia bacterium]